MTTNGVAVSGLLSNLPGTLTPYPTQDPLLELGGYRSVPTSADRDAIPANFRVLGMLVTLQNTGVTYELFGGLSNADWHIYVGGSFKGAYYVNSTFTGIQLGSQSNPFTTVAAAFAFAATVGVTSGVIYLGQDHTENVTFPTTGNWELAALNQSSPVSTTLTGTVDLSATGTLRRALTNLNVTGAVTGNSNGGNARARFLNCVLNSTVTLTGSAGGVWRASFAGFYAPQALALNGVVVGLLTVNGVITGENFLFNGGVTFSGVANTHEFSLCSFINPITCSQTGNVLRFINKCEWNAGQSFVSSAGTNNIQLDGSSWFNLNNITPGFTGTWVIVTMNANRSDRLQVTNNYGPNGLTTASIPPGQLTVTATLTLLAAGTLGVAQVQVNYIDLTGVARSRTLGVGLNIAGAVGDEFTSSLTFVGNGSGVSYQLIGIVTPGALSLSVAINLKAEY